jgi:hypothetical protein
VNTLRGKGNNDVSNNQTAKTITQVMNAAGIKAE